MTPAPELSVVVALVSGRVDDLRRCLTALREQRPTVEREILVPYDDAVSDVVALESEFPEATFFAAEGSRSIVQRGGVVREHHDSLRTQGLKRAAGRVVALTEDHAQVSPDWCYELMAAVDRYPEAGAVGGAVDCDSDSAVNWAVYFGDFGRYQSPFPETQAEFVSDANVAYRRDALEQVADGWKDDYHETNVHWAMAREGWQLVMTPNAIVWQRRGSLGLGASLLERFVWGTSFARGRCHDIPLSRRVAFALGTPLIPFLFCWRGWKIASSRGRSGRFLSTMPLFFLLQCFWAAGELAGYASGET